MAAVSDDAAAGARSSASTAAAGLGASDAAPVDAACSSVDDGVEAEGAEEADSLAPSEAGMGRRLANLLSRLRFRVWDNLSFTGEVLIEWLELDKPRYHNEIKAVRRAQRLEAERQKEAEATAERARIAGIEEAAAEPAGAES
mmetsp:Transcript_13074/g.24048  ORF Transcript_13074/g.24048 Transcript_13074/m.24048 type:complete len:143 (-) Transcript_13074:92-520(-)